MPGIHITLCVILVWVSCRRVRWILALEMLHRQQVANLRVIAWLRTRGCEDSCLLRTQRIFQSLHILQKIPNIINTLFMVFPPLVDTPCKVLLKARESLPPSDSSCSVILLDKCDFMVRYVLFYFHGCRNLN